MPDQVAQQILQYIQQQEDELVSFLTSLVASESPTGAPEDHNGIVQLLASALEGIGYETTLLPGPQFGEHVHAYPKGYQVGDPAQLLLGHYDTVWPKGTLEKMPVLVKDGMIFGPGVYDMKAGLTIAIFALKTLHHLELQPPLAPLVLFNSDEEKGSRTSTPYIRELAQQVERAFVLEPSLEPGGKLKTARKGVGRFIVRVQGKASHAGLAPGQGQSAILELSYVIQKLFALNDLERGITVNVGMINGGVNPNVVAPQSTASVDVRVLTDEDAKWIEQQIKSIQPMNPAVSLEIKGRIGRPPLEKTPRNLELWRMAQVLGERLGLVLDEGTAGGGSDGNTTSQYTATLDGLGAVGDGAHADHEFVYIKHLLERCALLALLLLQPAVSALSPEKTS